MIISIIKGAADIINVTAAYPYSTDDNDARRIEVSTQEGVPKKQGKKHKTPPTIVINRCAMLVKLNETPERIADGINIVDHVVFATFSSVLALLSSSMFSRLAGGVLL